MTDSKRTRKAWYIGRRIEGSKLFHSFADADDTEAQFFYPKARATAFKGAIIGRQYELGGGIPSLWRSADTGAEPHPKAAAWQAQDVADAEHHRQKSIKPNPELLAAVDVIAKARASTSFASRVAFDAWLLSKIH